MGEWRKEWQKMKKEYPDFTDWRNDKLKLGPLMDEHEKHCNAITKDMETLEKMLLDWSNTREKLRGAYNLYEKVAEELGKSDKKIVGDFHEAWELPKQVSVPKFLIEKFFPRCARI